ncbi:hypothetical protein FNF31_08018 [Cafeteria roenbergensis]|uniref:Uncharacterized protein n=1 Tax=Cafeteria roenbergensis TaxID=33653 RepID=A0A5A8BYE3_CAFRO|nr:hypothetical protein FNF31_08018 [Cafeteria roenbergensis]
MMAVVRERYLRDDVPCMVPGAADDSEEAAAAGQATMLSAEPYEGNYLVLDANVALHQLDLLETQDCAALQDCIVPQTAAEEVRRATLPPTAG